jgi:preprotein translocase subunit SecY
MFNKIIQIFKIPELRNKILFVLGIFVVFRIMANIPIPGIDGGRMREFLAGQRLFGFLDLFTGGALEAFSIVMLGLGPYITATIIMQLLTMIFPGLNAMYKEEGEAGRQKFNQYGRLLTVPFAALQSFGMLTLLQQPPHQIIAPLSPFLLFTSILTITAGCVFLMWLGELITEKGIGNGISLLIFAGIIAMVPMHIRELLIGWNPADIPVYLLFFSIALLIIAAVVLINEGRRNIPVSYAKRVRGMKMYGGSSTYLPLNINPAGVIPIIFAMSIILLPGMIAGFFVGVEGIIGFIADTITNLLENPWIYSSLFFILIVLFTYFYTAVTFDPKTIATNLQKMGGFIPGVRPGQSTAGFIYFILNRVLLVGAIFLGIIAILPSIIAGATGIGVFEFLIGGTAILIIVSVVLETMRQVKAQLQMREYETF